MRQESRQRLVTAWQNYCESGDDLDPNSPMKQRPVRLPSIDDDVLPLPEGVLTTNLGLDIVVVVTKVNQSLNKLIRELLRTVECFCLIVFIQVE